MKRIINIIKKKPSRMRAAGTPEERVRSFIEHWNETWSLAKRKMGDNIDFDYWARQVAVVDNAHFVEGAGSGSSNSFGSKADYDPAVEKITDSATQGEFAQVCTESPDSSTQTTTYHVYDLRLVGEVDWRIESIYTLFHDPKGSVVDPGLHEQILSLSDPDALLVGPSSDLKLNEVTLFQQGKKVEDPQLGDGVTELREVGSLKVTSGVLGILDLGYDIYDFEPLSRKVSPGEYLVEVVVIFERVAGIRVRLGNDEVPVRWCAANTKSGNGVYGVDAGNLAIFDVEGLFKLTRIEKEKVFGDWCVSGQPTLLCLGGRDDCVITSSGFGDGAYPAFWGLNEKDEVVSLYIDFMVLVKETDDGFVSV